MTSGRQHCGPTLARPIRRLLYSIHRAVIPAKAGIHISRRRAIIRKIPRWPSGGDPPVPIPNTEVKPSSADNTDRATGWEDRSPPGFFIFPSCPMSDTASPDLSSLPQPQDAATHLGHRERVIPNSSTCHPKPPPPSSPCKWESSGVCHSERSNESRVRLSRPESFIAEAQILRSRSERQDA